MNVVIFGRVSTSAQDFQRQINELTEIASIRGWKVRQVFAEKISGAKKNAERKELSRMIEYIEENHIDKVMVSELSRLGRDTLQVLQVMEQLNELKVSLYLQNYNIETLNDKGEVNPMSQFLITILAEIARMERKTIRERMQSGYKNYLNNGGKVGRKSGSLKDESQMLTEYADAIRLLRRGLSLRQISSLTGHSVNTVRKVASLINKSSQTNTA